METLFASQCIPSGKLSVFGRCPRKRLAAYSGVDSGFQPPLHAGGMRSFLVLRVPFYSAPSHKPPVR